MGRRRRGALLRITGKTTDDRDVVSGVFKLFDTNGLPLDIVVSYIHERGKVVNWPDFVEAAEKAGWLDKTIRLRIKEAVTDAYGGDYYKEWLIRFDAWMAQRGSDGAPAP
jgi:hypothetical protein